MNNFFEYVYIPGGKSFIDTNFIDYDNDNDFDLIINSAKSQTYWIDIYENKGNEYIYNSIDSKQYFDFLTAHSANAEVIDIDSDGDLDILFTRQSNSSTNIKLFVNTNGNFEIDQDFTISISSNNSDDHDLKIFDIDNDNDLDILIFSTNGDSSSNIYVNVIYNQNGVYNYEETPDYLNYRYEYRFSAGTRVSTINIKILDIDHDGQLEFVLAGSTASPSYNVFRIDFE